MKIFIVSILLFSYLFANDYKAKSITKENLKALNSIDEKIYSLATKEQKYNFDTVSNFIYQNLKYDLDFSRFKVIGSTSVRATKYVTPNPITNRGNMARAQIMITYPFFDAKENNARLEKMVTVKQKIISDAKSYFELKAKFNDLKIQKLILLRIETREKSRKLSGVGSFNDWLKVIEDIRKINAAITNAGINKSDAMQTLLAYVKKDKVKQLKEML